MVLRVKDRLQMVRGIEVRAYARWRTCTHVCTHARAPWQPMARADTSNFNKYANMCYNGGESTYGELTKASITKICRIVTTKMQTTRHVFLDIGSGSCRAMLSFARELRKRGFGLDCSLGIEQEKNHMLVAETLFREPRAIERTGLTRDTIHLTLGEIEKLQDVTSLHPRGLGPTIAYSFDLAMGPRVTKAKEVLLRKCSSVLRVITWCPRDYQTPFWMLVGKVQTHQYGSNAATQCFVFEPTVARAQRSVVARMHNCKREEDAVIVDDHDHGASDSEIDLTGGAVTPVKNGLSSSGHRKRPRAWASVRLRPHEHAQVVGGGGDHGKRVKKEVHVVTHAHLYEPQ